jgi:hypothetical protein
VKRGQVYLPQQRAQIYLLEKEGKERLAPDLKRYSDIAITLHYDFSLSHNALILSRIVITSNSYRSEHVGPIIASYSYRSDVTDKHYHIYSPSLLGKIA